MIVSIGRHVECADNFATLYLRRPNVRFDFHFRRQSRSLCSVRSDGGRRDGDSKRERGRAHAHNRIRVPNYASNKSAQFRTAFDTSIPRRSDFIMPTLDQKVVFVCLLQFDTYQTPRSIPFSDSLSNSLFMTIFCYFPFIFCSFFAVSFAHRSLFSLSVAECERSNIYGWKSKVCIT